MRVCERERVSARERREKKISEFHSERGKSKSVLQITLEDEFPKFCGTLFGSQGERLTLLVLNACSTRSEHWITNLFSNKSAIRFVLGRLELRSDKKCKNFNWTSSGWIDALKCWKNQCVFFSGQNALRNVFLETKSIWGMLQYFFRKQKIFFFK